MKGADLGSETGHSVVARQRSGTKQVQGQKQIIRTDPLKRTAGHPICGSVTMANDLVPIPWPQKKATEGECSSTGCLAAQARGGNTFHCIPWCGARPADSGKVASERRGEVVKRFLLGGAHGAVASTSGENRGRCIS